MFFPLARIFFLYFGALRRVFDLAGILDLAGLLVNLCKRRKHLIFNSDYAPVIRTINIYSIQKRAN